MGALRVVTTSGMFQFGAIGSAGTQVDYLMLDSWKAELVIAGPKFTTLYLNGSEIQTSVLSPGADKRQMYFKFGGMVLGDRPVNLNQRLEFSLNGGTFDADYSYTLTKTYRDPDLQDPSQR